MKAFFIVLYGLAMLTAASNVAFAIAGAGTWQGHASSAGIAMMYFLRELVDAWRKP